MDSKTLQEMSGDERKAFATAMAKEYGSDATFGSRLAWEAYLAEDDVMRRMADYEGATRKAMRDAERSLEDFGKGYVPAPTHAKLNEEYAAVMALGEQCRKMWNLFVAYLRETGKME